MKRLAIVLACAGAAFAQDTMRLTLAEAERVAVQNNPRYSSARYTAAAAGQVPKEYRSAYQPSVFGALTTVGASDGSRIAAGALNNPVIYNRFASGLGVNQLITDFGRTKNLVGSAESRAKAEEQNSNATKADVMLRADRAYFGVLRSRALLTVAEQTVNARQMVANQIHTLAQNALKSNLDVSFAEVNLQEAKLMLASAQNDVKAAEAELAAALGLPGERNFALADEPVPGAPPDKVDTLISEAVQNRPELASLRLQQQAAQQFAKSEQDLNRPSVGVVASLGLVPVGVAALQNRYGAVGLNVNIPVFNGGLFTARRREAELREKSTEENVKDLQNEVVRDVRTSYLTAMTGYERLSLTQKLLDQAQLGLNLAKSRYDLGLGSIVELSQAQLNLTSAQIANTSARYDYQAQWSALQFQIGALK